VTTLCRATLNYIPRAGLAAGGADAVEVEIRDARATDLPGWRECGFELVQHSSAVRDWTDDDEIAAVHYGEIEAIARELTGCDFALVSDHVKRSAEELTREREQQPVRLVHSDFAADYVDVVRPAYRGVHGRGAATLARTGATADDVEQAERIVMFQFWRNLGPAKMDLPVAFCDNRTVAPDDTRPFRYTGYVAGGRSFNALGVMAPEPPARHDWYAFPELTPDEVVAFRTYDTDLVRDNTTWFTPHSAFRDPDVAEGAPARFSIELRVMCLFR
jgi:hypothetical protein